MGSRRRRRATVAAPESKKNDSRRNLILIIAGAVVVLVGLIALIVISTRPEQSIAGVVQYPAPQNAGHEPELQYEYEEVPQHGGPHNPAWQNCGVYEEPVRPENAVHSLEHGVIWITYQPDLPADQVEQLQQLTRGESHILLSPYPNQRSAVFMTTWVFQLEVDSADDSRVDRFIDRYLQDPATTPELGASCSGQVGNPIDR